MSQWACPRCPVCDAEPLVEWVIPFFCPSDDCRILSWNPEQSRDELREGLADDTWRKVDLTGLTGIASMTLSDGTVLRAEDVDPAGPDEQPRHNEDGPPAPGAPRKLDDPGNHQHHRD